MILYEIGKALLDLDKQNFALIRPNLNSFYTLEDIVYYVSEVLTGVKCTFEVKINKKNTKALIKIF